MHAAIPDTPPIPDTPQTDVLHHGSVSFMHRSSDFVKAQNKRYTAQERSYEINALAEWST